MCSSDYSTNFSEAFHDLESLATELAEIRDKLCEEAIEKAKSLCEKWDIDKTIREDAAKCPENWVEMLVFPQKVKFLRHAKRS